MDKLIIGPLKKSSISTVIVIDALDECKDDEPASAILSVLGQFLSKIPKVKFFLTGRPEPWIQEGFRYPLLAKATKTLVLHNVEPDLVKNDIRCFLKQSFLEIAHRKGLEDWPTTEELDCLCERAGGLFVYAVATVKFVDRKLHKPRKQLEHLLQSPESSAHEGKAKLKPNLTLDLLYLSILQEAFDNPEDDPMICSILSAVVLSSNPLSPSAIAALLGFDLEIVFDLLSMVHSLLLLQDVNSPVRPFHKSFPDFIVDPTRCTNKRFYIFPPNHHPELLVGCLKLMNQKLKMNMCKLKDAVVNRDVSDLGERIGEHIIPALQYACSSWHKHLTEHTILTPEITSVLHHFLKKKFLYWLEVLSVTGATTEALDALRTVAKSLEVCWVSTTDVIPQCTEIRIKASPTLDLFNDCYYFVTRSYEIIQGSAPHIYHSALPLSPKTSIVWQLYNSEHAKPLTGIVHGLPALWEESFNTMKFPTVVEVVEWSPCSRFIAVSWGKPEARVQIWDVMRFGLLTTLEYPLGKLGGAQRLAFSPDGCLLTWFGEDPGKFITWDIQTGVMVSAISPEQQGDTIYCLSIAYSACGTMFGASLHDDSVFTIQTYSVLFGTHTHTHSIRGTALGKIWSQGECFQVCTVDPESITIWEAEFTSTCGATEVVSLDPPYDIYSSEGALFHSTPCRLANITKECIQVWSLQDSKLLLDSTDPMDNMSIWVSFSPDGQFFACGIIVPETISPEIYLWKESPSGYILHQKLLPNTGAFKTLISPNGELVVGFGDLAIQLWHTPVTISPFSSLSP